MLCKLWHLLPGAQTTRATLKYFRSTASLSWSVDFSLSQLEFVFIILVEVCGEIGFANENYLLGKQMNCNASNKESHTCYCPSAGLSWTRAVGDESFFPEFCSLLPLARVVSTAKPAWEELPGMKEHFNVTLSSSRLRVIIQLIFFFSVVPAAGAVITIYLGSLFHYSRAAVKPEEKCCFMIYGGYLTCVY